MRTLNARINQIETTIRKRGLGEGCPVCRGRLIIPAVEGKPLPDHLDENYRCRGCGTEPLVMLWIVPDSVQT